VRDCHLSANLRYAPDALDNADKDVLITFSITFLSPGYVNNPFLKAKLVSVSAPTGETDTRSFQMVFTPWATSVKEPYSNDLVFTPSQRNTLCLL